MDNELKGEGNSLNYEFRMHDPRVGRFFAIDPLTSEYPHYSPYSFSGNKVIAFVELEGLEEKSFQDMKKDVKALIKVFTSGQILEGPNTTIIQPIKRAAAYLESKINSIPKEKRDNLKGNNKMHFKDGYKFKDKNNTNNLENNSFAPNPELVDATNLFDALSAGKGFGGKGSVGKGDNQKSEAMKAVFDKGKQIAEEFENMSKVYDDGEKVIVSIKKYLPTPTSANTDSTVNEGADKDTAVISADIPKIPKINRDNRKKTQLQSDRLNTQKRNKR